MDSQQKGKLGEKLAIDYLSESGYKILEKNYHSRYGEIDVIVSDKKILAFVEVKLRKLDALVLPGESVIKSKQKKIIKTAYQYILKYNTDLQPRFDVIEITVSKNSKTNINHIKNAFWQDQAYSVY